MDCGAGFIILIKFTDGEVKYYNGKPAHHVYHAPNRLSAKKWKRRADAERAMAKIPKHDNQSFSILEIVV